MMFLGLIMLAIFLSYVVVRKRLFTKENGGTYLFLKASLDRVISRYRLLISEIDFLKNEIIALDSKNNKVVLILGQKGVVSEKCFALSEVQSCRLVVERNQLTSDINRVVLKLVLYGGEVTEFIFYDEARDSIQELPSRHRKARYWKSRIQLYVNSLKQEPKFEYVL